MKNLIKITLAGAGLLIAGQGYAQTKNDTTFGRKIEKTANKVGNATSKAAKAVGKKTSELAAKGAAAVTDKRYEGHWALTGELVYIDENGKYFYVDREGHRQFITKAQMRSTKPAN